MAHRCLSSIARHVWLPRLVLTSVARLQAAVRQAWPVGPHCWIEAMHPVQGTRTHAVTGRDCVPHAAAGSKPHPSAAGHMRASPYKATTAEQLSGSGTTEKKKCTRVF
jgi:hypothetical protein